MCSYFHTLVSSVSTRSAKLAVIFCLFLLGPTFATAATLSFIPEVGSFSVGSIITVSVLAGSGGTALNAVSGTVTFPKDIFEVVSINKSQSIVSLWVQEPAFSNEAGSINFEGIILNPGYTGASGKVITVNFKVKATGVVSLSFTAGSILANDGSGTEILSSRGVAQYKLISTPKPTETDSEPSETTVVTGSSKVKVTLTSTTNPPDSWSNKNSGLFNFTFANDVTSMRLLVDDTPDSMPLVVYTPPIASRTIDDLTDGISYLHVQYKDMNGWGEILHYPLQIDTIKPGQVTVTAVDTNIFWITAKDALSGIHYFEVMTPEGETIKLATTSPFYHARGIQAGEYTLTVKAFDNANNYTETPFSFTIPVTKPIPGAIDTNRESLILNSSLLSQATMVIAILSVVIPCLALLLLVSALLFLSWRSFGGFKKKLDKEIYEARSMVHKSFTLLKADLEIDIASLQKASVKRKLTREELKILKRLQKNIEITEQLITKEVLDIENKAGL